MLSSVEEALTVARLMREAGPPTSLTKRKRGREATLNAWRNETTTARFNGLLNTPSVAARPIAPARGLSTSASLSYSLASCCRVRVGREARGGGGLGQRATAMTVTAKNFTGEFSGEFMPPFKPKPRQPSMSKAELRAQGVLALAQASKPVMKLPMKIKRQCARCDHFNSVLVEPGEAVPAFKCLACGYSMARP